MDQSTTFLVVPSADARYKRLKALSKLPVLPENGKPPALACGMGFIQYQGRLRGGQAKVKQLADFRTRVVGRPVVDETGLQQNFDVDAEWIASSNRLQLPPSDVSGPSIFSALEEQLGLKLESRKGPVDFLVIDHVEQVS
jgi:uncharacterized protein (TIGR03435 family)